LAQWKQNIENILGADFIAKTILVMDLGHLILFYFAPSDFN